MGEAFESEVQQAFDPLLMDAVDSYDGFRRKGTDTEGPSEKLNEKVLEQLRSLGYIE